MLRLNVMRSPRRRRASCAVLLTGVFALAGCSSGSTPTSTADPGSTSRFTSLFSGSPNSSAQPAAGGSAFNPNDCPNVEIRTGAGALTITGKPPESSTSDVRYQLSFSQVARQCMAAGTDVVVKIGVQGRIVVGPAGAPGEVDIPVRYAVVQEGGEPRTIATKFKRIPANVPDGQSNVVFSDVEDDLSFSMPSRTELAAYRIYVGFDEIGDAPDKKPVAKKPAAKAQMKAQIR